MLPGIGGVKAAAIYKAIAQSSAPFETLESAEVMALSPSRSKGFLAGFIADLRQLRATMPDRNPAGAVSAILKGGYPATVRLKYERPDNRISDIEQFGLLAAKYDNLERLIADLLLAGDVYGMDSTDDQDRSDALVLSDRSTRPRGSSGESCLCHA